MTLAAAAAARAGAAVAADPEPAPVPAILELFVNTVDEGTALTAFAGNDILVSVDDITKAGITITGGTRQAVGGRSYVSLDSLAPSITFAYDEQNVVLRLTVDPHLLAATELGLRALGAPKETIYAQSPSAFLNYAVNGTTGAAPTIFGEQGVSLAGSLFDNTVTLEPNGHPERGQTSFTIDNRTDLTRVTVGDIAASGGALGGAVALGGIGYSKNFAINPYFLSYPTQRFAGVVDTPSTADIYVNGQLVRSVTLPPGPFNLLNIPGATGAGVTRIVVRNAFGQQQELGGPYYQSATVLAQGLSSFTYDLGVTRSQASVTPLGAYELPAAAATHLYGFSDKLTAGGFLQSDERVTAGGPQAVVVLPFGQVALAAAASESGSARGWSSSLGYSYEGGAVGFSTTGTYTSANYADLALGPENDRARWQVSTVVNGAIGAWNASLQLTPAFYRIAGSSDQASATLGRRLGDRFSVALTLGQSRARGQTTDTSLFLGFTVTLGPATVGSVAATHDHDGSQLTTQVAKSLPAGPGYGYLAQVQTGRNADDAANLQYQTTFGTYEADISRSSGQNTLRYSASGALAMIGGDIAATTALRDAYALIRVAGVPNVTGYLSNLEVGRTDANGDLFIPNLISYYGNRLEIDQQDLPFDYRIDATELIVSPPYRGGAVVEFPVHRFQAFTGSIGVATAAGPVVPSYGELTLAVADKSFSSPVGEHGEFYFESLPAGSYPATLVYKDGRCDLTIAVPISTDRTVKLGPLTCVVP